MKSTTVLIIVALMLAVEALLVLAMGYFNMIELEYDPLPFMWGGFYTLFLVWLTTMITQNLNTKQKD